MQTSAEYRIPRAVVWAIGITQVVGYGSLYYAFGVLAPDIAKTFDWPIEWLYGALTAALLVGAAIAPIAGSLADKLGAARLMMFGSVGATVSLIICALAGNGVVFLVGLATIEIASAFVLYSTAFAALAQLSARGSRQAITNVTLIAGFASSIFWPLTSFLLGTMSWQMVYLVYAGLNLLICLPLHWWIASHTTKARTQTRAASTHAGLPLVKAADERVVLPLMLVAFALKGFISSAILVHLVPVLSNLGLGGEASLVAVIFGPAQVAARLLNLQLGRNLSPAALAVIAASLMPIAALTLAAFAPVFVGALAFAVLFGFGSGLSSIVSGTLPLALFGAQGYGRRLGLIGAISLLSSAFAPFLFALLMSSSDPRIALAVTAISGLGGTAVFALIWWMTRGGTSAVSAPGEKATAAEAS